MVPVPDWTASERVIVTWLGAVGRGAPAAGGVEPTYWAWAAARPPAAKCLRRGATTTSRAIRAFMASSVERGTYASPSRGRRPRRGFPGGRGGGPRAAAIGGPGCGQ